MTRSSRSAAPALPDHSFVGNTSTRASSTLASSSRPARRAIALDGTAAYWMPTLLVNGQPVMPVHAQIYYYRARPASRRGVPARIPDDRGRREGDRAAGTTRHVLELRRPRRRPCSTDVPTCPNARRAALRLHVTFPSCWDGKNLDSADHGATSRIPSRAAAPPGTPALPQLSLIYATRPPAARASRSPRAGSTRRTPTSSTRGVRASCSLLSTAA